MTHTGQKRALGAYVACGNYLAEGLVVGVNAPHPNRKSGCYPWFPTTVHRSLYFWGRQRTSVGSVAKKMVTCRRKAAKLRALSRLSSYGNHPQNQAARPLAGNAAPEGTNPDREGNR